MSSLEPIDDEFTDIELIELSDETSDNRDFVAIPIAAAEASESPPPPFDSEAAEPDSVDTALDERAREAHALATQLKVHASGLAELDDAELADHVTYYQKAHADLQRALSDVDNS